MGATSLIAADVMDSAASLMNDTLKTVYTYDAQMPYLNMALRELQEHFQLNNIPVSNETTTDGSIIIPVGTKNIRPVDGVGSAAGTDPTYPADLIQVQTVYERLSGSTDPFIPLVKREFLPHAIDNIPTDALQYWIWERQVIKFIGALTAREIKMDYIRSVFPRVVNESQPLGVINAETFLFYRTAALCTRFIGENPDRSGELNDLAIMALDRVTGIESKAKQSITTRRKPFMAAYKRRSFT